MKSMICMLFCLVLGTISVQAQVKFKYKAHRTSVSINSITIGGVGDFYNYHATYWVIPTNRMIAPFRVSGEIIVPKKGGVRYAKAHFDSIISKEIKRRYDRTIVINQPVSKPSFFSKYWREVITATATIGVVAVGESSGERFFITPIEWDAWNTTNGFRQQGIWKYDKINHFVLGFMIALVDFRASVYVNFVKELEDTYIPCKYRVANVANKALFGKHSQCNFPTEGFSSRDFIATFAGSVAGYGTRKLLQKVFGHKKSDSFEFTFSPTSAHLAINL